MAAPSQQPFDPSRITKASAADFSSSSSEGEEEYHVPGEDHEFGDFNPRKRRRIGGNSKEKAALGIFGSDSEDDGPSSRWKKKTLRSKGMNFVTTAAAQDDEEESDDVRPVLGNGTRDKNEEEEEEEEEEDEVDEDDGGVGLGFGAARGMRWEDQRTTPQTTPSRPAKTRFSSSSILGNGFVPSSASQPVLNDSASGHAPPEPRNKPQPSAFGPRGKVNAKSFGARMMAKMGYVEGTGLGKEGQGRNVIIEANLRPQGIGLGAVKEKSQQERKEEKRQAELRGEAVVDSDEEKKKKRKRARNKNLGNNTTDSAASTPRRQKTRYLTAEELKAAAPGLHIPDAFAPILDMTGPGGKLLTSTSGIMTPTSGVPESAETVEARKLAKRAQADLLAFSEEWRSLEERKTWMGLEVREKEQEIADLESDFDRLQVFSNLVTEQLVSATEWSQVVDCLQNASKLGSTTDETADIAVAAIHPFLRSSDWDPIAEPARFASDLKGLRSLLIKSGNDARALGKWDSSTGHTDGVYRRHHKATTPYESMMYKNWLPQVLAAVRSWDAFTPAPMLAIMENWDELLPPFVRAQFMDNIARKLETAVSDWNPRKKRQGHHLPHTWLFPWLQYLPPYHLDPRGTGLVADVKRKFRQLIDVWEFDRGTVPGLRQWEEVLGDQWRPLIVAHVLPSMGKYLRTNFRVDPADQEPYLPVLTGIMKWNQILGGAIMTEVLVQDMFPMWSGKLQEWLALEEADLAEVAEWYAWWRGVLLKDMAGEGARVELDKGMRMMNTV